MPEIYYTLGAAFIVINLVSFSAFFIDKRAAQSGYYRISESTLLLFALMGGTVGSIVAQQKFRHKTRKQPFKSQLYSIAVLQAIVLMILLLPDTRDLLFDLLRAL